MMFSISTSEVHETGNRSVGFICSSVRPAVSWFVRPLNRARNRGEATQGKGEPAVFGRTNQRERNVEDDSWIRTERLLTDSDSVAYSNVTLSLSSRNHGLRNLLEREHAYYLQH